MRVHNRRLGRLCLSVSICVCVVCDMDDVDGVDPAELGRLVAAVSVECRADHAAGAGRVRRVLQERRQPHV